MDTAFGRLAFERGFVTDRQLRRLREESDRGRTRLRQVLVQEGLLTLEEFCEILKELQLRRAPTQRFACTAPGKWIGGYRIVREIAHGGMGVVYEAEDPRFSRHVAIKTVRGLERDEFASELLRREGAIQAQLSPPRVPAVYGTGIDGGRPYLVMEYVEGPTLADLIDRRAPIREIVRILEHVAETVGLAHDKGIIHADLKPANVIAASDGRVVLADFGLAHWKGQTAGRPGEIVGTPLYMAPEQVRMEREIDPRADVWALGVILHEAATGRNPFEGYSTSRIADRIVGERPPPLGDPGLESICRGALEKDRRSRTSDGREFARQLRRWREGRPVRAGRLSRWWSRTGARLATGLLGSA